VAGRHGGWGSEAGREERLLGSGQVLLAGVAAGPSPHFLLLLLLLPTLRSALLRLPAFLSRARRAAASRRPASSPAASPTLPPEGGDRPEGREEGEGDREAARSEAEGMAAAAAASSGPRIWKGWHPPAMLCQALQQGGAGGKGGDVIRRQCAAVPTAPLVGRASSGRVGPPTHNAPQHGGAVEAQLEAVRAERQAGGEGHLLAGSVGRAEGGGMIG
jgi:hypothetical protein